MMIELPAGATIGGKYRVERLLGRGAVGTVYSAEHLETGKRVALKCVDTSYAIDPASAERLVREAQAAARIRHANVVDIYDVGRDDKLLFLVMEYLEGEPLSALLAREELPVHRLIAHLLPAMRGVAEAHRQGVVHRDIKPENIFFARQVDVGEPVAKVLDFGISKLDARGRALRSLTADGHAIGTPGYMAYEQAMGDKTIDGRADVYAFGAILYEALTGRVPHSADDFSSLARDFITQRVPTPSELGATVSTALSALVMWAIERDREQRVSSMASLIRELEPFAVAPTEPAKSVAPPVGGRTLAGPWGVKGPSPHELAALVARKAAPASLPSTTIEEVAWLQRSRKRHARGLWLLLGISLLALGSLGFSLWPTAHAPQPKGAPRRLVQHSVSAATMRSEPRAEVPTPELPPGLAVPSSLVEAPHADAQLNTGTQEPARVDEQPPKVDLRPTQPKPKTAAPPMPAAAPPAAPKAPPAPQVQAPPLPREPAAKRKNYGIY
jgi:serine/threonine-protein kinase